MNTTIRTPCTTIVFWWRQWSLPHVKTSVALAWWKCSMQHWCVCLLVPSWPWVSCVSISDLFIRQQCCIWLCYKINRAGSGCEVGTGVCWHRSREEGRKWSFLVAENEQYRLQGLPLINSLGVPIWPPSYWSKEKGESVGIQAAAHSSLPGCEM